MRVYDRDHGHASSRAGAEDVRGALRPARTKTASYGRRAVRPRVERFDAPGERDVMIGGALRRLEREHVALLLALCELDDASGASESPAMREALRVLLRDDLSRTQHALALAARGAYGVCEDCARPIARRALELKPATTRCTFCEAQSRYTPQL